MWCVWVVGLSNTDPSGVCVCVQDFETGGLSQSTKAFRVVKNKSVQVSLVLQFVIPIFYGILNNSYADPVGFSTA